MCEARPGQRCSADTLTAMRATCDGYDSAFPGGPSVTVLAGAEAEFLARPVTEAVANELQWHERHELDGIFYYSGENTPEGEDWDGADFDSAVAEYDLAKTAIWRPHPDPAVVREAARRVVALAQHEPGGRVDDAARARFANASDLDVDRALTIYRERMLGEPTEASTEFMTNALSRVLAGRELAGVQRPATGVERAAYEKYVINRVPVRTDDVREARALLGETRTVEGEPMDDYASEAVDSASDAQIARALGSAVAYTRDPVNGASASADQFGDTLATRLVEVVRNDEAARYGSVVVRGERWARTSDSA